MHVLIISLYALCLSVAVQSRVLIIQDAPITPEGLSVRISLKEDLDPSGQRMATIKMIMDDDVPAVKPTPMKYTPHLLGELIPDVETRFGIRDGKCPKGRVRRGNLCTPI